MVPFAFLLNCQVYEAAPTILRAMLSYGFIHRLIDLSSVGNHVPIGKLLSILEEIPLKWTAEVPHRPSTSVTSAMLLV